MASLSGKIASNTAVQIMGKAGSAGLGLLTTLLLTRYLGPAGFGSFTFAFVFVTLFGTLADWGTTLITVREASREPEKAGKIIGNIVVVRFLLAVAAAGMSFILIWLLPHYDFPTRLLTSIASLTLLGLSLKTSFQIIFNVKLKMHNWAISELASDVIIITLVVLAVVGKLDLNFIVASYVVGDLIAAVTAFFLSKRMLNLDYKLVTAKTKYMLWESLPMGAILVVFTIYNRIDTVILSYFKGTTAVGYYGLAYKVYEIVVLGAAYFANSVLPVISNLAITDRKKLGQVYQKSFVILLGMGGLAGIVNFLWAPLLPVIFGNKFTLSVAPLQILSLALVVAYFNHLNGYTLVALGRQWWSFGIAVLALIINIGLNLLLIPHYSYLAAAFTTFLTEGLIIVLSTMVIKKQLGVGPRLVDIWEVTKEFIEKRGKIF